MKKFKLFTAKYRVVYLKLAMLFVLLSMMFLALLTKDFFAEHSFNGYKVCLSLTHANLTLYFMGLAWNRQLNKNPEA
jgi:hypothetical protein